MTANYNSLLLALSFAMSILASWVALDLSARVHLHTDNLRKSYWLAGGSVAMGVGIWSMHYIGMLAFHVAMPVLYDWPTVVLSLAAALVASASAFLLVTQDTLSWAKTMLGGTVMGGAIASMHYIGMAAMRMPMGLSYSRPIVALSIAAAVSISVVGLRLTFGSRELAAGWSGKKTASALLMGFAIPTTHYIGMAAVRWTGSPGRRFSASELRHAISATELGTAGIIVGSLVILGLALVSAYIDHHMSRFESALDGSKRNHTQLLKHHERLRGAFRAGGFGIWECDPATGLFYVDAALRDLYGITHDSKPVPREVWKAVVHPDDVADLDQRWAACLASGDRYDNEYRIIWANEETRYVKSVATLIRDPRGRVIRVLGMTWEVTSERHREEQLRDQANRFRLTLNSIGDAVIATDDEMRIVFINPAASKLTGWGIEAAVNCRIEDVFRVEDELTGAPRPNPIQRCIEHNGLLLAEDGVLISQTGERFNIRKHVALVGSGASAVITFQDITAARRVERELHYAATHDVLTKLANRAVLEDELNRLWKENRNSGRVHCLCMIDLDRFKIINDVSGHLAGDALLKEIARVLKGNLRPVDTLARMGGDEFMLLLPDTTVKEATSILEVLLNTVGLLRFPWQGKTYGVTASIGMASFDRSSPDPEALISQADAAVYTAKRNGRNQISTYFNEGHAATHLLEMQVASDLRRCIEEDSFELQAQPIVSLKSPQNRQYFEVLLRMLGRDGKLVSPALFIPAAERFGMMALVDRWVVRNTLRMYQESKADSAHLGLAINLSASSLSDPSLWQFVSEQFLLTEVDPAGITFEVTETAIIENLAVAKAFMTSARRAGCRIALDDFGTGLSSLSYLKQFPLDIIKVDGGFVRTLITNPLDQEIVRAIGQIARSIGAITVAECVENAETIEVLKEIHVDYIQGWAIGRPEPLSNVLKTAGGLTKVDQAKLNALVAPFLVQRDVA